MFKKCQLFGIKSSKYFGLLILLVIDPSDKDLAFFPSIDEQLSIQCVPVKLKRLTILCERYFLTAQVRWKNQRNKNTNFFHVI